MKNLTTIIFAALLLSACGNSAPSTVDQEAQDAATETLAVDSLTSELDAIEKEIDNNIDALDDALNDL